MLLPRCQPPTDPHHRPPAQSDATHACAANPLWAPLGPQRAPKRANMPPQGPQRRPRGSQKEPQGPPNRPKASKKGSQGTPSRPKLQKGVQEDSKRIQKDLPKRKAIAACCSDRALPRGDLELRRAVRSTLDPAAAPQELAWRCLDHFQIDVVYWTGSFSFLLGLRNPLSPT